MALMLSKTYEALIAAGAPEDKAREAAEELAEYQRDIGAIDARLARIETGMATIETNMATKTWVLTAMLTQTFALLGGMAALIKLLA